ncbi:MAG TPA: hypothetical protein VK654_02390 [Nitrospirota bacterium]|nr:hypothetical protein [Nitrospirota bacterium]
MNKTSLVPTLLACAALFLFGCSNKNSKEACTHQVTMDLDAGHYDSVLASSCSDSLQRGAAYFGRAGFDTTNVVNVFIQTGASSGGTSTQADLTVYLTSLVSTVTETTLSDLDRAEAEYSSIPAMLDSYQDAQFYLSLACMVKGLSLLKILSADAAGALDTTCDINNDSIADGADASSCALIAASNISTGTSAVCSNATYSPASPADITFPGKTGTYSGLVVTLQGTGTTACPSQFKKLLYRDGSGHYWVAVATPDIVCTDNNGAAWPCPVEENGQPVDFVASVGSMLDASIAALQLSLITVTSDVQTSLEQIKNEACPSGTCTSIEIAQYLHTVQ